MKKFLIYPILAVALLTLPGCRHNVNTSNPQVVLAATLLDASNTVVTLADGLTAADHVLDQLQASDPAYYAQIKPLLIKIAKLNDVAVAKIAAAKAGDATADWKGAIIAIGSSVTVTDFSTVGIKNPTNQALASAGLATLIAALELIPKTYGSVTVAPSPTPGGAL